MSRKIGTMDFARIWGLVSKLSPKQWLQLVDLHHEQVAEKVTEGKKARKPRGGTPEEPKP